MSAHLINTIRNCQHVDIPAAEWEDQLNTAADSLCLSRAQLDSLLAGQVSPHMRQLIEDCPHLGGPDSTSNRQAQPSSSLPAPELYVSIYPNPHTNAFSVAVDLPDRGEVKLTLVDVLGREVLTLFSGELAAGAQVLHFAPDLPAGVYVCRIEAAGLRQHHPLVRTR